MLKSFLSTLLMLVGCSLVLSGCAVKDEKPADPGQAELSRISCIGVLPAAAPVLDTGKTEDDKDVKSVRRGVEVMDEILSRTLGGRDKIRFVGIEELASLQMSGGENPLTFARLVGESIGCNAVLETTVKRYDQRVGGRYSVESPASVAFDMRLISLESGSILWSAKFDEVQKSVMENILEWGKANTRGFVWITAEELMREGIREKFADSPYFSSEGEMAPQAGDSSGGSR
ncbi:MAG TPA: hypothetical protein ENO11_00190 [Desulfobacteraceae bacterium]|nr:hypothetical protein [Desulfobacteraceae bacterium]